MTIVSYSTVPDNNQALAPENTMPVNAVNDAIRTDAANVRAFANELPWYDYGSGNGSLAAERVSSTQFRVAADLQSVYAVGRRVRAVGTTTGDIQGTITSRAFSSPYTTVTVLWDSGLLAAETITIYVSMVVLGSVGVFAGKSLVLSEDQGTRLNDDAGDLVIHAGGSRVAVLEPNRVNLYSTESGASANPLVRLFRRSDAPAAFDQVGAIDFYGRDSALADALYGRVVGGPTVTTAGATSGFLDFYVAVAGAFTRMVRLRPSVLLMGKGSADGTTTGIELHTSGDAFARDVTARTVAVGHTATPLAADFTGYTTGTVEVARFDVDGTKVAAVTWDGSKARLASTGDLTAQSQLITSWSAGDAFGGYNHSFSDYPGSLEVYAVAKSATAGFSVGDRVRLDSYLVSDSLRGVQAWSSATQYGFVVIAGGIYIRVKATGATNTAISDTDFNLLIVANPPQ